MLSTRNTAAFKAASLLQYGTSVRQLLADAQAILARPRPRKASGGMVGAVEVAEAARDAGRQISAPPTPLRRRDRSSRRCRQPAGFGRKLMIASSTAMLRSRVDALLAHEVSVHLLTHFNGAAQGLTDLPHRPRQLRGHAGRARRVRRMGGRRAFAERGCACSPGASSRSTRCSTAPSSSTSIAGWPTATAFSASPRSTSRRGCSARAGLPRTSSICKGFQDVIEPGRGRRFARSLLDREDRAAITSTRSRS